MAARPIIHDAIVGDRLRKGNAPQRSASHLTLHPRPQTSPAPRGRPCSQLPRPPPRRSRPPPRPHRRPRPPARADSVGSVICAATPTSTPTRTIDPREAAATFDALRSSARDPLPAPTPRSLPLAPTLPRASTCPPAPVRPPLTAPPTLRVQQAAGYPQSWDEVDCPASLPPQNLLPPLPPPHDPPQ